MFPLVIVPKAAAWQHGHCPQEACRPMPTLTDTMLERIQRPPFIDGGADRDYVPMAGSLPAGGVVMMYLQMARGN
jgi:hypothetical protein